MKDSVFFFFFRKHGYKLLFILALAMLIVVMFSVVVKTISRRVTPRVVFTQWRQNDVENNALLDIINEFEKLNPGIKIVLNEKSYEDLHRALFSSDGFADGDIIALDPLWVPELLKKGIIESPQAGGLVQSRGLLSFINVLYYNIEILKEAGFSRPPKSRGEFLNYARTLGKKEFSWRYALGLALGENSSRGIYDDIFPWIWAAGVELVKDGKPAVNTRQVVESLSFLASLNSEGLIAPGAFSTDGKKKLEDFVSGRIAFMIAPSSEIEYIRKQMGDEKFGVTSVPAPDNYAGKTLFGSASWTVGVYSASSYKKEAGLFADFLAAKASVLSEKAMAMPGNGASPAHDPFYSKVWDIAIAGEIAQDFTGLSWTEPEAIFREELRVLFEGKSSPAETAAAIQKKWETGNF
jgi:multiple sugar transport system substrate-binding protein